MALGKTYSRINWENYPSSETPLNESNLNRMDYSLNEQDNRIVSLDNTKLNITEANKLIKNVTFNEQNGVFTFTYYNGTTKSIDTAIEKVAINFDFDETNQRIVLTLIDGTKKYIDVSSFITNNEFSATDTISFNVSNGIVKANVVDGSITESKLQPNFLAECKVQAQTSVNASQSAQASVSQTLTYMQNAKQYAEKANQSELNAQQSSQSASQSAKKASEVEKKSDETLDSVEQALITVNNYVTLSQENSASAKQSSTNASKAYADTLALNKIAESWAIGNTGTREGENSNNSKYFSSLAETYMHKAEESSNKAENYSNIVAPDFMLDEDEMCLYIKVGVGLDFMVDDDNVLYWTISA